MLIVNPHRKNNSFPVLTANDEIYTVSYYDNYAYAESVNIAFDETAIEENTEEETAVKGMITTTLTKILTEDEYLTTVNYYIQYNFLNLPEYIYFGSSKWIKYTYDAAGIKLSKLVHKENNSEEGTTYIGSYIYDDNASELKYIAFAEGRIVNTNGNLEYEYSLKDHLGNPRVVFYPEDTIIQRNDYYPFGLEIAENHFDNYASTYKNDYL